MGSGSRQSHHFAEPAVARGTESSRPDRRVLLTVYVLSVALVTAAYAVFSARHSQSWIVGEWLIDYAGGFVRRGLLGQAIVGAAGLVHISPVTLALALQLLLYTGFYACVLLLARAVSRTPAAWALPLAALFFSPATLSFIVLDPPSSVRKEVLLLLALAVLLLTLRAGLRRPVLLALLLTVATVLCVLSHEGLVFYLPYLFAPVFLAESLLEQERIADGAPRTGISGPLRRAAWVCLPAAIAAVLSAAAAVQHSGSPAVAAAVCHSLGAAMEGEGHGLCGGAIAYLAHDRAYARADVLRAAHAYHYGRLYGTAGLLALAPVAWLFAQLVRRSRSTFFILLTATATAMLGSVVLFVYARDWGRWISIHVTCLLLLFLSLASYDVREAASRALAQPAQRGTGTRRSRSRRAAAALALVVYATCWNLPATGNYHARWGYAGLVHYFRSYRTAPHHASSPP